MPSENQYLSNPHDHVETERPLQKSKDFSHILQARLSRRTALKGIAITGATAAISPTFSEKLLAGTSVSTLTFPEVKHAVTEGHEVAKGYSADILLSWGDNLKEDKSFSPQDLTPEDQENSFGYNPDFIAFMPIPKGSNNSDHGLLTVNHEYSLAHLMFSGYTTNDRSKVPTDLIKTEQSSVGMSVVEVKKKDGKWDYVVGSMFNRRITVRTTEIEMTGPVAGHDRVKTSQDPEGKTILGTVTNCSGGVTPWGTVVSGEENFHGYFSNTYPGDSPEARNGKRYGITNFTYVNWGEKENRFNVLKEPNEANRFGWIVEVDPYNPYSKPMKRTALGRFKHEGVGFTLNFDGRLVAYMGDDERFEYIYRFVTDRVCNAEHPYSNNDILDHGTLSVAEFKEDGKLLWHPLVFGEGPLTKENGFSSQADVLIETRRAADLVGATPMDRPESVVPNPKNNKVYAMLTCNKKRSSKNVNAANRREKNYYGQMIEMTPPGDGDVVNHAAHEFEWDLFIECGNPTNPKHQASFHKDVSPNGWFVKPDNCNFDNLGRMWITTDCGFDWVKSGFADGLYACDIEGEGRGLTRQFMRAPIGAELTGPCFTPDNKTLFVSAQHPGESKGSTFDNPSTRWPDFDDKLPPRPSVIAVTKDDGGTIGS